MIREIVNRQARCGWIPPPFIFLLQNQGRNQPHLPIMNVHHVRPPRQITRQMHDALGEINIARIVVRIAVMILLINSGTIEKSRLIYEINLQPLYHIQLPQFRLHILQTHGQIEIPIHLTHRRKFFTNATIQRRDHARLVPFVRQCPRQRAHHIRQSARFGKRKHFAAGE